MNAAADRTAAILEGFAERGFAIVDALKPELLTELRGQFLQAAAECLGVDAADLDADSLHDLVEPGEPAARFRQSLTNTIASHCDVGAAIYAAFDDVLGALLGPDVLSQRVPNIVFQPPRDPHPTELHRDAPANSAYEVVAWLPLTDCFGTKSMYLLDRAASTEVMTFYRADPNDREGFESLLRERAEFMEVGFGQVLLFWSGLFHGSVINDESQTRLSLNTRYKSLFAPLGLKDPFRYFTVLRMSALTRLGLDFQRTETFAAVDAAPGRHHDQ